MNSLLSGDISKLSLPRDLELLHEAVQEGVEAKQDLSLLYAALAENHPQALLDLAIGPRAPKTLPAILSVIKHLNVLEQYVQPKSLYRRLALLNSTCHQQLLRDVCERHPSASWLIELSAQLETTPGRSLILYCLEDEQFPTLCEAISNAGKHQPIIEKSLIETCVAEGRPEGAAALLKEGLSESAITASVALLEQHPAQVKILMAWLAAIQGPSLDPILTSLIYRLQSPAAIKLLKEEILPYPMATIAMATRFEMSNSPS